MQSLMPLTPNEKKVLEFIESFFSQEGFAPAFAEIKTHFGFASFNSVQRYLQQLEKKGYVSVPGENKKRAIRVLHSASTLQKSTSPPRSAESFTIPLLGSVAAGLPIEALAHDESVDVPPSMLKAADRTFALRVKGNSMIEDGIFDGDLVLVQQQDQARSGEIVVATVDNEATVKRIFFHKQNQGPKVELRPANSEMNSLWYEPEQVQIRGLVVGLMRKY